MVLMLMVLAKKALQEIVQNGMTRIRKEGKGTNLRRR